MGSYKVEIKKSAQKEIRKLPQSVRMKIIQKINKLYSEPMPVGAEKIKGYDNRYRLRQGDYRILYSIFKDRLVIMIVRVQHRKDVYKDL